MPKACILVIIYSINKLLIIQQANVLIANVPQATVSTTNVPQATVLATNLSVFKQEE